DLLLTTTGQLLHECVPHLVAQLTVVYDHSLAHAGENRAQEVLGLLCTLLGAASRLERVREEEVVERGGNPPGDVTRSVQLVGAVPCGVRGHERHDAHGLPTRQQRVHDVAVDAEPADEVPVLLPAPVDPTAIR